MIPSLLFSTVLACYQDLVGKIELSLSEPLNEVSKRNHLCTQVTQPKQISKLTADSYRCWENFDNVPYLKKFDMNSEEIATAVRKNIPWAQVPATAKQVIGMC